MHDLCSNDSDERIVVINRLYDDNQEDKNKNKVDKYIFTKDRVKLKENDFATQETRKVTFVETSIYADDNIKTIRSKIARTFNVGDSEVYLFLKKKIASRKEYIIEDFLSRVFANRTSLPASYFNAYFKDVFDLNDQKHKFPIHYKKNESSSVYIDEARKVCTKKSHHITSYNIPLSFDIKNSRLMSIPFITNPFHALSNEDRIMYKSNTTYEYNDLKDLLHYGISNDVTIYAVVKEDLQKYGDTYFTAKNDYIQDLYFPSEVVTINEKKTKIISEIDTMKQNINKYNFSELTKSNECSVSYCSFSVVDKVDIKLHRVFNVFQTSRSVPFTGLKTKSKEFFYRLYKHELHNLIDRPIFNKWIEREQASVVTRKKDQFSMKIRFKETKHYGTLIVRDTGQYSFGINLNTLNVSFNELMEYIQSLNNGVFKEIGIKPLLLNENTYIEDLKVNTNVTMNRPVLNQSKLEKSLNNNPFYSVIRKEPTEYLLRYKRVSDFSKMDNITSFIASKIHLPYEQQIQELMNEFEMDKDTAVDEYEKKKDTIKLKKQINANSKVGYVAKYNEGVIINLKIVNQNQLFISVNRMNNVMYHSNIVRKLILLTSNADLGFSLNMNKSMYTLFEDFQDDASETNEDITLGILNDMLHEDEGNDDEEVYSVASFDSLDSLDRDDVSIEEFDENAEEVTQPTEPTEPTESKISPEDYSDLAEVDMRSYISRFVNNKLKSADKDLFVSNYSKHCPVIDKKMPVVISKNEKLSIDEKYPKSYSGFVKAGTTEELKNTNYYICPMVWCPISRTSVTFSDIEKNNGKCPKPYEETPISFHKEGYKKKQGEYYKYPYFLNKNIHPNGKEMICCGYKKNPEIQYDEDSDTTKDTKDTTVVKNDRYIKQGSQIPLKEDRLSTLPPDLHNLLNSERSLDSCAGFRNDKKNDCFMRRGVNSESTLYNNQKLFQSLYTTLNIPTIKSTKAFIKHITTHLTKLEYIFLNNGNTLKTFMKVDWNLFDEFKDTFIEDTEYVKKMNLMDIRAYLLENDELNGNDSYIEQIVQREFLIHCSFVNFKEYIGDNKVVKDPEITLDLMNCASINPSRIQYLIIDISSEDAIYMLCPKYASARFDKSRPCVVLIKIKSHYEQLVKYANDANTWLPFNGNDSLLENLVRFYTSNCKEYGVAEDALAQLKKDGTIDIQLVVDYSVKLIGFYDTKSKVFISLPKGEPMNDLSRHYGIRYIDSIDETRTKAQVTLSKDEDVWSEHRKFFIGYQFMDKRMLRIKEYIANEEKYFEHIKSIVEKVSSNKAFKLQYVLILHKLNPLSTKEKLSDMLEIIEEHYPNNEHNKRAAKDVFFKTITVLENIIYEKPNINEKNEHFFNKSDLLEGTILLSYDKSNNPYKMYDISIEDIADFVTVTNPSMDTKPPEVKYTFTMFPLKPNELYKNNLVKKSVRAIDLPVKQVFEMVLKSHTLEAHMIMSKMYDDKKQREDVLFWLNIYETNAIESVEKSKNKSSLKVSNGDELSKILESDGYNWGIIELIELSKHMDAGLILFSKTKTTPNSNELMIQNNMFVVVDHPERFIMVSYMKDTPHKLYLVVDGASSGSFVHNISNIKPRTVALLLNRRKTKRTPKQQFVDGLYNQI